MGLVKASEWSGAATVGGLSKRICGTLTCRIRQFYLKRSKHSIPVTIAILICLEKSLVKSRQMVQ
jgi:hypothetical protein